jgi:hypothetical protein
MRKYGSQGYYYNERNERNEPGSRGYYYEQRNEQRNHLVETEKQATQLKADLNQVTHDEEVKADQTAPAAELNLVETEKQAAQLKADLNQVTHDEEVKADQAAPAAELNHAAAQVAEETRAKSGQTADDAKVTRYHERLTAELQADIRKHGEGGWISPFYTGLAPAGLTIDQIAAYRKWRRARDNWTRTGDSADKQALLDMVDFDCPPSAPTPDAVPVTITATRRLKIIRANPGFLLFYAAVVTTFLLFLVAVVFW